MMQIFSRMTRYNRWMNERLMQTCSQLSDAERKRDCGAPFGSIHGLWNHLLVCDRLWLARFAATPMPYSRLDEEICATWDELREQRAFTDDAIDAFVASLSEERLDSTLHFVSLSNPQPRQLPLWVAVQHLFNHQTHHRGRITALMEQGSLDCGVTDLAAMPEME